MSVTTESKRELFRRLRELDDGSAFAKATSAIEGRGDVGDGKAERETIIAFKHVYVNRIALIATESGTMLDYDIYVATDESEAKTLTLRESLLLKLDKISDDGDESLRYAKCRAQKLLLKEVKDCCKRTDIGLECVAIINEKRAADKKNKKQYTENMVTV